MVRDWVDFRVRDWVEFWASIWVECKVRDLVEFGVKGLKRKRNSDILSFNANFVGMIHFCLYLLLLLYSFSCKQHKSQVVYCKGSLMMRHDDDCL